VQKHLVPTFRAGWLLFQAFLSFLIRDCASLGTTEPIYGVRADDQFGTAQMKLRPAEIEKQLADLAIVQSIQVITQCATQNQCGQSINRARRLAKFSLTFD
jgi:hypothetical protein